MRREPLFCECEMLSGDTVEFTVPNCVFNNAERVIITSDYFGESKTFPAETFGSDSWISVKDELPKFKPTETCAGPFWVSRKFENGVRINREAYLCREGTYTDDCWWANGWGDGEEYVYSDVTHWMPLPDDPQEVDND